MRRPARRMVLASCAVFATALAPGPAQAASPREAAEPPASKALDLRLPPAASRPALSTAPVTDLQLPVRQHPGRTMQFEPRKSFIEWGAEGSREALIACQKGAYPGATVAAYGVPGLGAEGQPDHCRRF